MGNVINMPSGREKGQNLRQDVLERITSVMDPQKRAEVMNTLGITETDLESAIGNMNELVRAHEEDIISLEAQGRRKMGEVFERMIVDKEGHHDTYAAFGNEVFPVVDADRIPFPVICPEYAEFLKINYPEKYQAMAHIIGWLRDMTSPNESDSQEYKTKYPLGIPMKEFARIVKLPETSREYQMLLNKLRQGIMNTADFMMPERHKTEAEKMKTLNKACERADVMYGEFISETYGKGAESEFGLTSEVHSENDPAQLILMAFNEDQPPRIRFEAMRKALDSREIGSAELRRNPGHANRRNVKIMDQAGVFSEDPETHEKWKKLYLVSHHPRENGRQCTEAYFTKEAPAGMGPDWIIEPMQMRSSEVWVKDEKTGESKLERIYYHWIDREKSLFKMIQKGKIKDSRNQDQFTEDHNGQRILLEKLDHWQPLIRHKKGCLRKQGCDMDEWDWEVSVDGRNFEKVSARPGQSSQLQIIKHMEAVTFPASYDEDGNQIEPMERHNYENQYFDPKMYANYENQIGVNHAQYMVNRVMESSYASLTTPNVIYGHDPLEWQLKRNLEIIKEMWDDEDAIEFGQKFIEEKTREITEKKGEGAGKEWAKRMHERFNIPTKEA